MTSAGQFHEIDPITDGELEQGGISRWVLDPDGMKSESDDTEEVKSHR